MKRGKRKDFITSFLQRVNRGEPTAKAMDEALIDSLNLSPLLDGLLRDAKRNKRNGRKKEAAGDEREGKDPA